MGLDKATLPFGPELMLTRVVRLLGEVVDSIVVVAAAGGQELPPLPPDVRVVRDQRESRGPLEGLYAGLSALPPEIDAAYATSCDVPLLVPAFVSRMFDLLEANAIAVPYCDDYPHPLAAVYRPATVLPVVDSLLKADRLRPVFLFEMVPTRMVKREELVDVDPELSTLENLNHPVDYLAALASAGFSAPPDVVAQIAAHESRRTK